MPHEKLKAEVDRAAAAAREDGMTPAAIASLLHRTIYTVAGWDKLAPTSARSFPGRAAQCL